MRIITSQFNSFALRKILAIADKEKIYESNRYSTENR